MNLRIITFLSIFVFAFLMMDYFDPSKSISISSHSHKVKSKSTKSAKLNSLSQWSERKRKVKGLNKFDEPDKFNELHKRIRTRDGELAPSYEINYRVKEFNKAKARLEKLNKISTVEYEAVWTERGPANVGGRTRGLLVDLTDPTQKTWFAASVGGGVWKTTDAGLTWELKTPDIPNLSMSYFGYSPSNPNIIYVGTGEGFFNLDAITGNGIFKSVDKGETWVQIPSTVQNSNFSYVNRLAVHPNNANIIIAATNAGIFKSIDGGDTWVKTYNGNNVQDLVANPLNFSTLYATQNGAGVLKSIDEGNTWFSSSNGISGAGRLEIDIAPTDTNRLYVSAESSTSLLFLSSNAGVSWNLISESDGSSIDWLGGQGWYDNAIAVHPYDENIVFYAGIDVWKSVVNSDFVKGIVDVQNDSTQSFLAFKTSGLPFLDGGAGSGKDYWDEDLVTPNEYVDVEIRFGNGVKQKAYRFVNATYDYQDYVDVPFQVWDVTNNKQLMASFSDSRKNKIFDLSTFSSDNIFVHAVDYDSTNLNQNIATTDGVKFKNLFVLTPLAAPGVPWNPSTQPESSIKFLTGDVPIFSKVSQPITDGYNQYGIPADIHVDQHELVMIPKNETTGDFWILNSNDGGVAFSNDGGTTWFETDQNGYNTSQFYGADKKPNSSEYFGGMQDNGTWQSTPGIEAIETTPYKFRIGGDGYETSWNYSNPNKLIGGSQYNRFWKSNDGGITFSAANNGFTGWGNSAVSPFVSKIAKTNSDPDLLFTITREGVWRTDNFAENWFLSPIPNLDGGGLYFSMAQVAISIANPQIVWAGSYMNNTLRPFVSKDGGFNFSVVNGYNTVNLGLISGLDTHPTDEATAYLTFSFANAPKILRTTNYGQTWEDISGFGSNSESNNGFPNVAVYCVAVMPFNTDIIWAGTDIGIVESLDNGTSWHLLSNGLPSVSVWEIKIVNDQVVIATHGRGIWSATISELSGYEPPQVTLAPRINGNINVGIGGITIDASLRSVYDSTQVIADGKPVKTIFNDMPIDLFIKADINTSGNIQVYLLSFKDGKTYMSSASEVFIFDVLSATKGYYTEFESNQSDFVLDGLTIEASVGFNGNALQSPHPYETARDYIAVLRAPIIVAETDAVLTYKDVAIIETGEPGTVFGDEEFWDYVVVEGFKNGEWIPLSDGYDARFDNVWANAFTNSLNGENSMLRNHSINLLDKFSANDTILIRFRLFSDPFVTGWGWLIDDLTIQGQFVSVDDVNAIPNKFALEQNYPNPFNPSTKISFSIPQKSNVTIKIYNNLGQIVETLYQKETEAGFHNVTWNAKSASGIYYYSIEAGDFKQTKKMVLLK